MPEKAKRRPTSRRIRVRVLGSQVHTVNDDGLSRERPRFELASDRIDPAELEQILRVKKICREEKPSEIGTNVPDAGAAGPLVERERQFRVMAESQNDPLRFLEGKRLGRTTLVKFLHAGETVSVFEGRFADDERPALVKVLKPGSSKDALERLRREADALSRIEHANVATLFEHGLERGHRFVALELGAGVPLGYRLELCERLDPSVVAIVGRRVTLGLAAAHEAGVSHRDLRPANVLIDDDFSVKLVGFGVALPQEVQSGHMTGRELCVGHPCYTAPEVLSGKASTTASDVYSLGCVLYEALAGRVPFAAESAVELAHHHLMMEPVPIVECPPRLEQLVRRRLLAKRPAERPTAAEVATLLAARDLLELDAAKDALELDATANFERSLCSACGCGIVAEERDSLAVLAGKVHCRACTSTLAFPCEVCGRSASLRNLVSGEVRVAGLGLRHSACRPGLHKRRRSG